MSGFWGGKHVMVVGASSGIGRALTEKILEQGGHVFAVARDTPRLHEAVAQWQTRGLPAEPLPIDVMSTEDWMQAARTVEDRYGRLDVLIYGAGVLQLAPAASMNVSEAKAAMDTLYWGAVHAVQAMVPLMMRARASRIAFISSLSVPCTPAFFTPYVAPKYALHGLARCLEQELRPAGMRVCLIMPGPVDTPLVSGKIGGAWYPLPPGVRILSPEEAAEGVLHAVERGRRRTVIPRSMAWMARLADRHPRWMEKFYEWTVPGWKAHLSQHLPRPSVASEQPFRSSAPEE